MKEQQQKLNQKLRGHDAYYGVTDNYRMLSQLQLLWQVAGGRWQVAGGEAVAQVALRSKKSNGMCSTRVDTSSRDHEWKGIRVFEFRVPDSKAR